jgi:hypothetical protein
MSTTVTLRLFQSLPISGARVAAAFSLCGHQFIIIPQLAQDIPSGGIGVTLRNSECILIDL